MIDLSFPLALVLLPLPWIWHRLMPSLRQRQAALRLPFFDRLTAAADLPVRQGSAVALHRRGPLIAGALMWGLLVLALSAPVRLGPPQEITRATRDVILAVDISGSMDTVDFPGADGQPLQRLAGVRLVLDQVLQDRAGDRLALIVFGSRAYVQAPLTEDLDTLRALLEQTAVGMAGPHTALGDAIGLAIRTFEASAIEDRLLILLSDGNDTASRMSPVNAAEIARDHAVRLFAIGVGDPQARGEYRLDMTALQDPASRTGGAAFFATDVDGLAAIYAEIDALAPRAQTAKSWRSRQTLAHGPLLAALLLGLALLLDAARRPGRAAP